MTKNILLILTDQHRKDSLGCYGNSICRTPNLDKLAAEGVRFERNYVANPICMPNRLSIFTGKNIRNHGLWTNGLLIDERETMANVFQQNGYQTASIGKIHFTPHGGKGNHLESMEFWSSAGPDASRNGPYWGFEHVELCLGHTAPFAHYGRWFYEHGGTDDMLVRKPVSGAMQSGTRSIPEDLHDSTFVAERTVDFIRNRNQEKPFFLVASFPDPHHPFDPPEKTARIYAAEDMPMPSGNVEDLKERPKHYMQHFRGEWDRSGIQPSCRPQGVSEIHTRELIAHSYAMIDLIDRRIGTIMDTLESEGLREDTIVVFTSDHGELLGDHGLWLKGPFFYEGLINTPLIISSRNQFDSRVSTALFSDIDIAPTLFELAGVPCMMYMDGLSHASYLIKGDSPVREACLVEYRNGYGENDGSSKAIITDRHKYVRYHTGEEEMTDLENDPTEKTNVAKLPEYNELKEQLQHQLLDEILATEIKGPEQVSRA